VRTTYLYNHILLWRIPVDEYQTHSFHISNALISSESLSGFRDDAFRQEIWKESTSPLCSHITNLIESGSISLKNDSSCLLYSSDRWICHILHCHNKRFPLGRDWEARQDSQRHINFILLRAASSSVVFCIYHCSFSTQIARGWCCFPLFFAIYIFPREGEGERGSVVVKALCYKPEGCWCETRWGEFLNLRKPSCRSRPWGLLSLQHKWVPEIQK
jgi:hypothetical protein